MDAVEILFALENEFDINIPDDEVRSVRNVRQMCEGVARLVAAKIRRGGRPVAMRRVAITGMGAISRAGPQHRANSPTRCAQDAAASGRSNPPTSSQLALSERRRGPRLLATSHTSRTAARTSSTASRSSR